MALSSAMGIGIAASAHGAGYLSDLGLMTGAEKTIDVSDELPSLSGSFLAAQIAAANGDDAAAIENYRRAIKLDPDNVGLKQALFAGLTGDGQIAEAIELLQDIPPEFQNQNINHAVVAANALKQKSWSQAVSRLKKVAGTDLDNMLAQLAGAWAQFGARDMEKAIAGASQIDGPDWMRMIKEYHTGLILAASGKDSEAVTALEIAVSYRSVAGALTETYMRAMQALAISYSRLGNLEKANSVLDEGLALISRHPAMLALKAAIANGDKPTLLLKTAQQGAAEVFYNVGSAISRQGRSPFAQSHLQLSHFLAPQSDVVQFALGNVYQDQEKYLRANDLYTKVADTSPYFRSAQLEYAINLDRLDQFPTSEAVLSGLIAGDPDDLIAFLTLGGLYASKKSFDKAVSVYDAAISRISNPERLHWNIFYRRGIAHERLGEWPDAEADFKQALELYPEQPDVLNYLGYSWIDQGINLQEGLGMIRKAVELKPNSGFIIDSLGWAYYRLGRYEDAVVELETALEKMPSDPVIIDHLGDAYWKTGRKLEAIYQWRHALSSNPTEEDAAKIQEKIRHGLIN